MTAKLDDRANCRRLILDAEGPIVSRMQDLLDLIQQAFAQKAAVIVLPVARLDPEFFQLRSGLAGEFVQKVVNYQLKLVILGDISAYVSASDSLRDFVRESNRGSSVFFVSDLDALAGLELFKAAPRE